MTFMKKSHGSLPLFLAMVLAFALAACGLRQAWREVESFNKVKAGMPLRLQPLGTETLKVSPDQEFRIRCTSATAGGDIEYRATVGVVWDGGRRTVTIMDSAPQQWSPQKSDIVFQYHSLLISDSVGRAKMYFYLVDKDDRCISNIIEWNAVFVQ